MKPIHECAVVKDGNRRAAYLITQTSSCCNADVVHKHWELVDAQKFEQLVKENQVQFLTYENGAIKCRYTNEEFDVMKRTMKKDLILNMQEHYWEQDVTFKFRHVMAANSCKGIACSLAGIVKVLGMTQLPIFMYGDVNIMMNMLDELRQRTNVNLNKTLKHNMENVGQLIIPLSVLDELLRTPSGRALMFDTSLVKYQLRNDNTLLKKGIVRPANSEKAFSIVTKIDRATLDNEKYLGI